MYVKAFRAVNIRSFTDLEWKLEQDRLAGWHVVIGDNGSGKTSFLRAMALGLVGPEDAMALQEPWERWIRNGETDARVDLLLNSDCDWDLWSGSGAKGTRYYPNLSVVLEQNGEPVRPKASDDSMNYAPKRHAWGKAGGWFSASYGPFRRFTGGDRDYEKLFYSNPKLARHLSLFGESVALTECLEWLQRLKYMKLEGNSEGDLLDSVVAFVNQPDFLPHGVQLHEVSSKGVVFKDGDGLQIRVEELSDGFRSVLSLTFELIRQLAMAYPQGTFLDIFDEEIATINAVGVVLIDEIDAHLHPTWQRRIGQWLIEHFPAIQFIVTTHSPLVCQAAERGSVYRLPTPGTDEIGQMVTGLELERLLYGDILEAYSTEMFGDDVSRSESGQHKLQRLASLNQKEKRSSLTPAELAERELLRAGLPLMANADEPRRVTG